MKFFVGWDVGGWHCDKNASSRDALVVVANRSEQIAAEGKAWRGNLRSTLMAYSDGALISQMLGLCGLDAERATEVIIAIDAPLGWPSAMMRLAQGGTASFVSAADGENPYTRRATELALIQRGFAPLSAVRDMLGSQSTKGLHFLRAAGLQEVSTGVWRHTDDRGRTVTAIETYPAVALQVDRLRRLQADVLSRTDGRLNIGGKPMHDDVRDALACALVAAQFVEGPAMIEPIPADVPAGEGWIVLPAA